MDVDAVALAQPEGHRGLVDGRDQRGALAAVLEHVVGQQAVALQLVDEDAVLVDRAGPVGVAVEQQAQVVAAVTDALEGLVDVRPDGLGIDAAEPGVALAVELVDDDACHRPAAG